MKGKKSRTVLRWISHTTGNIKWMIGALILLRVIVSTGSVFYALILRNIVNAAAERNAEEFISGGITFAALSVLLLVLQAVAAYVEENTSATVENRLKHTLFRALLHREYAAVTAVHSGEWINRLTSDTNLVATEAVQILPGFISTVAKMLFALAMIIQMEPRFCFFLFPAGAALILGSYFLRKHMVQMHKKTQEKSGRLRVYMQEVLSGLLVVRSYAVEKEALSQMDTHMQAHKSARLKKSVFTNICSAGFGLFMNSIYIFGVVFFGWGILNGTLFYGDFVAMLQLVGQVQGPIAGLSGYMPRFYNMIASAERLMGAEDFGKEKTDALSAMEVHNAYKNRITEIGLSHVSFTYRAPIQNNGEEIAGEETHVLQDISLLIKKGEYVAFVGNSGCGKSTILKLFLGLYEPEKGEGYVSLSGNREKLTRKWQRLFAFVPQANYLMSGTIREVIAFADPGQMQQEERIRNALKIACAEGFVNALENGIDTQLGERGAGLSEGQMQRIAIARAVFSEHPILVLDESTAALDEKTEAEVLQNLRAMTDKTVLIVTHRPSVLSICDKLIRFDRAENNETDHQVRLTEEMIQKEQ